MSHRDPHGLLKKAVTVNPQSIGARLALVAFYTQKGDLKQAQFAAQEANAALPNDPRTLEMLGQVQLAAGDASQAVDTFNKLVAARPGSAEAEQEIKAIQRRQPGEARGYLLEGEFFGTQLKWSEAESAIKAAQKRAPDDSTVALAMHAATTGAGKAAAADAAAEKWLHDHPKDVALRNFLAERAARKQDYKSAARYYQAVVVQQPDNAMYLNNLAWALGELGDPKALAQAEKALALAPTNPAILDTTGVLLVKSVDPRAAPQASGKIPPLTCAADCAAEVAALLKTL